MIEKIKTEYKKHPVNEGVFIKHFFTSNDSNLLSNMEVRVEPGQEIKLHKHEFSTEFFYIISGNGKFFIDGSWNFIRKGDAMIAPKGTEHSIKNETGDALIILATFSPPLF